MSAAAGRCGYCDLPMEECRRLTDLRQHLEEAAAAWRGRGITFDPPRRRGEVEHRQTS